MSRKHNYTGLIERAERRADRLQLRADRLGRRSARQFGVVLSHAGQAGASTDADTAFTRAVCRPMRRAF